MNKREMGHHYNSIVVKTLNSHKRDQFSAPRDKKGLIFEWLWVRRDLNR